MPAASIAPVEPADTKPSASPSRTAIMPRTMLLSFMVRTAMTGESWLVITCVVCSTVMRSRTSSQSISRGVSCAASPPRVIRRSLSARRASMAPSAVHLGALSPPIASR